MPKIDQSTSDIDNLNERAKEVVTSNPKKALSLSEEAYQLAKAIDYPKGIADSLLNKSIGLAITDNYPDALEKILNAKEIYQKISDQVSMIGAWNVLGNIYSKMANFAESINSYSNCVVLCKKMDNISMEATSYGNMGNVYYDTGNYEVALDLFFKGLKIHQQLNNQRSSAMGFNNIANVYLSMKQYKDALDFYFKSLEIAHKLKYHGLEAGLLDNIALTYSYLGELEEGLRYAFESLEISESIGHQGIISGTLNKIGMFYREAGDLAKSLDYYKKSLTLAQDMKFKVGEAHNIYSIGTVLFQQKKLDDALEYFQNALELAEKFNLKDLVHQIHEDLSKIYQERGNFEKALYHHQQFHHREKEVFNENSDKRIRSLQIQFETERKENELKIYRLKTEQQKKELAVLARSLAEKNKLIHQLQLDAKQIDGVNITIETLLEQLKQAETSNQSWYEFQKAFDQSYPDFLHRLLEKYPTLTRQELKVCAFIKIGLTSKETAQFLYISKRSVEGHRYRIRKKLHLPQNQNLSSYISDF